MAVLCGDLDDDSDDDYLNHDYDDVDDDIDDYHDDDSHYSGDDESDDNYDDDIREEGSTLLELCGDLASPVTVQSYSHQLEVCATC